MMATRRSPAFTLIELLTVIAIIAILVAIVVPIFARARESARQGTCFSNMRQIYIAASAYRDDHDTYPCLLLGYAERPDGFPWTEGEPQPIVAAKSIKHGFLYPAYINNIEVFHCPDNLQKDQTVVSEMFFTQNSPCMSELSLLQNGHT